MQHDSASKTLRVLCLHGFRTNSKIMADQTRDLRQTLQQAYGDLKIEFVYLNGHMEAKGPSDSIIESFYAAHKPFYECQRSSEDTWCAPYEHMDETIAYAHEKIQELGPFDMAVGFSQGTALLTVLTMWYLKHYQRVPWKLNVCVSGMRVDGTTVRSVFTADDGSQLQVPIPSVHLIGKADPISHETHKLASMYQTWDQDTLLKVVLEHESGHRFPSLKRNPGIYKPVVRMLHEVCPHFAIGSLESLAQITSEPRTKVTATTLVSRL